MYFYDLLFIILVKFSRYFIFFHRTYSRLKTLSYFLQILVYATLSYAGINLTGYHPPPPPPPANPGATNFFRQDPRPGDSFSVQNSGPRVEKQSKIPTPGHNLPSSNAKISMKRIRAVSFQIFHNSPFDNFIYRENIVFASPYTTVKINTAMMQ